MIKTIAKAIILVVGTALMGRPIWRHVSNFRGGKVPYIVSGDAT